MVCSLMDLRCKEVVNIQNGACLGCVCDVDLYSAYLYPYHFWQTALFWPVWQGARSDHSMGSDQMHWRRYRTGGKCVMPGTAPSSDVLCRGFALIEDEGDLPF